MNKHTEGVEGAYSTVTTRATGRVRLQLGHRMEFPVDRVEMTPAKARELAQGLIDAARLIELNAGAGVLVQDNPQRTCKAQAGRMELRVGLLIAATAASVYLYVDWLGTCVGLW